MATNPLLNPLLFSVSKLRSSEHARGSSRVKFSAGFMGSKMYKFFKVLGVLAVAISSVGQASASSFSVFPVTLSGSPEDVTISFTSSNTFNLNSLSLELGSSAPFGPNVLATGGSLTPFTSSTGSDINGSGSLSEIITAPAGSYTLAFNTGSDSFHFSVSAVPLPASFPLFALALIGLGVYHTARKSGRTSSVPA
jgi:hypothetical protein